MKIVDMPHAAIMTGDGDDHDEYKDIDFSNHLRS
jgi:hypothetical protein